MFDYLTRTQKIHLLNNIFNNGFIKNYNEIYILHID